MENNNYVAYEYTSINVKGNLANIYEDNFTSFGWKVIEKNNGIDGVNLKFKRNSEIQNKDELKLLQRKFESEAENIKSLESSKTSKASMLSVAIGVIGTAFMAGAVFSYLGGFKAAMIALAIVGFTGWISPYFLYKTVKSSTVRKVNPLIEESHRKIYSICKEARALWV